MTYYIKRSYHVHYIKSDVTEMQEDLFHIYFSLNQTLQLESCTSELVKLKEYNSLVHDSGCGVRFKEK